MLKKLLVCTSTSQEKSITCLEQQGKSIIYGHTVVMFCRRAIPVIAMYSVIDFWGIRKWMDLFSNPKSQCSHINDAHNSQ